MSEETKEDRELERRVNRLENFVWVTLVLAVAFGVGGASLWSKLEKAQDEADKIEKQLAGLRQEIDEGLPGIVETGKAKLGEYATALASQVTVRDGKLGIGTDNPRSRLHVAYGSGYVQLPHVSGSMPPQEDCNEPEESGRIILHDRGIAICPQGAQGWVRIN